MDNTFILFLYEDRFVPSKCWWCVALKSSHRINGRTWFMRRGVGCSQWCIIDFHPIVHSGTLSFSNARDVFTRSFVTDMNANQRINADLINFFVDRLYLDEKNIVAEAWALVAGVAARSSCCKNRRDLQFYDIVPSTQTQEEIQPISFKILSELVFSITLQSRPEFGASTPYISHF